MTTKAQSGKSRQRYSQQYKSEALALAEQLGVAAAARQLGINENQLYNWRRRARLLQDKSAAEERLLVEIARLKRTHGLPVEDKVREEQIIADNSLRIADPQIREQYIRLEKTLIELSKSVQRSESTED